jgi:hypothetical protein
MKTVILRTHKQTKSNSFSDALFRTGPWRDVLVCLVSQLARLQKVPFVLACFQASAAPRPENSDSDEKDVLFGLDTQITIICLKTEMIDGII